MLPFTRQQFFEVFAAYNADTWPAPLRAYLLAMKGFFFAWHATARSGRTVGLILALMWGWVGVVYQGVYFSQINPAARFFAGAFILQTLFFAAHAILGGGLRRRGNDDRRKG